VLFFIEVDADMIFGSIANFFVSVGSRFTPFLKFLK
jgi:hypothetical protein